MLEQSTSTKSSLQAVALGGWLQWAGLALPARHHLGRQRGQGAGLGCAPAAHLGGMGTPLVTARQPFGEPRLVL